MNFDEAVNSTSPKRRLRTSLLPGATPLISTEEVRGNQQKSKANGESKNNNGEHDRLDDDEEEFEYISFAF